MNQCEFCCKEFSIRGLPQHRYQCKMNPKRSIKCEQMRNAEWRKKVGKKIASIQKGKPLSASHRESISRGRKKFLDAHPDQVPYLLNHSSKKSWPEKFFEHMLKQAGISGWEYNYQFHRYRFDYAFPGIKLDVEIDGATHSQDKVKKIDSERDARAKSEGWTVIRIDAKRLYDENLRLDVLKEIQIILGS